jgi:hypothetical protein
MKFETQITAIDPQDGKLKTWSGPCILANSIEDAQEYCQNNGLGYLNVIEEIIGEIPYSISEHASYLSRDN